MNKKDLLKVLDDKDFKSFTHFYSQIDITKIIKFIMLDGETSIQFNRINILAELLFYEIQGQHFGEEMHFEVTNDMKLFREFIYLLDVFYTLEVPFDLWENLASDCLQILENLVESENMDYKNHPDFHVLESKIERKLLEVRKDPDMDRKYFDYLNGAL